MKITYQQLRNLTSGRLHTYMGDIYSLIDFITQSPGVMTHMIPRAMRAIDPWLRGKVADARFWEYEYDTTHVGEFDLPHMTPDETAEFWRLFKEQPDPLSGKKVIVVEAPDA